MEYDRHDYTSLNSRVIQGLWLGYGYGTAPFSLTSSNLGAHSFICKPYQLRFLSQVLQLLTGIQLTERRAVPLTTAEILCLSVSCASVDIYCNIFIISDQLRQMNLSGSPPQIHFYRATLCQRGICYDPVSGCVSVTSRCSTKMAQLIELIFCMDASFQFSTYLTMYCKEIRVTPKIRALHSETLSKMLDLENFATADGVAECCQ